MLSIKIECFGARIGQGFILVRSQAIFFPCVRVPRTNASFKSLQGRVNTDVLQSLAPAPLMPLPWW